VDPEGTSIVESIFKVIGAVVLVGASIVGAIYSGNQYLIGAAIGGVAGMFTSCVADAVDGGMDFESFADSLFSGATTGMLSGALAATGFNVWTQGVGNAIIAGADYMFTQWTNGEDLDTGEFLASTAVGFISGLAGGNGLTHQTSKAFGKLFLKSITKEASKLATRELLLPIAKAASVGIFGASIKNLLF
jgi:hypothetical protein